jgi:integral membrane protein
VSSSVDRSSEAPLRPLGPRLIAYRIAAWVTGVGLLLLVFYAIPVKYIGGDSRPTAIIGMIHGFLYMGYILCTLVLAERARWKPTYALLILLAGTIPVASFIAERKVTHQLERRQAAAG